MTNENANTTPDSGLTSNATVTVTLSCSFAGQCASEGKRCATCANNPANYKRDYYAPTPYAPWNPWNPCTIIWCDGGTLLFDGCGTTITFTNAIKDYYKQKQPLYDGTPQDKR